MRHRYKQIIIIYIANTKTNRLCLSFVRFFRFPSHTVGIHVRFRSIESFLLDVYQVSNIEPVISGKCGIFFYNSRANKRKNQNILRINTCTNIHYSLHWFACNVHNVNVHNWCAQCEFDIKFEYKLNGGYSKHIDVTALPVYQYIYQNSTIELRRVLKPPWNGCFVKLLISCAACGRYGNTCTQIFVAIICHHMETIYSINMMTPMHRLLRTHHLT